MALTQVNVKQAECREKNYKLFDGRGLYLLARTNGSKYWRFKYRYVGKERTLAFGVFPEVSLKEARDRGDDARRALRDGIDPSAQKNSVRQSYVTETHNTFEVIA